MSTSIINVMFPVSAGGMKTTRLVTQLLGLTGVLLLDTPVEVGVVQEEGDLCEREHLCKRKENIICLPDVSS